MWTVWILAAAFAYVLALAATLAFVAGAARGREHWERALHAEIEELHDHHDLRGFRRVA